MPPAARLIVWAMLPRPSDAPDDPTPVNVAVHATAVKAVEKVSVTEAPATKLGPLFVTVIV